MGRYIYGEQQQTQLTASEVLDIVRNNDGKGSQIDADYIDGMDSRELVSLEEAKKEVSYVTGSEIGQPYIITPTDEQTQFTGTITTDGYITTDMFLGQHEKSDWELALDVDFKNIVLRSYGDITFLTSWSPPLEADVTYFVRVRFYSGKFRSLWSYPVMFSTGTSLVKGIKTPIVTVEGNHLDTPLSFLISTGVFTPVNLSPLTTHSSTTYTIYDAQGNIVWQSLNDTTNLTSIVVPTGVLTEYTIYKIGVVFNDNNGFSSPEGLLTIRTGGASTDQSTIVLPPDIQIDGYPDSISLTPSITTSPFKILNSIEVHTATSYYVHDQYGNLVYQNELDPINLTHFQIPSGYLDYYTSYVVSVIHHANTLQSEPSVISIMTPVKIPGTIETPTITIVGDPDKIGTGPLVSGSNFIANGITEPHIQSTWTIKDTLGNLIWSTTSTTSLTTVNIPTGTLVEGQTYDIFLTYETDSYISLPAVKRFTVSSYYNNVLLGTPNKAILMENDYPKLYSESLLYPDIVWVKDNTYLHLFRELDYDTSNSSIQGYNGNRLYYQESSLTNLGQIDIISIFNLSNHTSIKAYFRKSKIVDNGAILLCLLEIEAYNSQTGLVDELYGIFSMDIIAKTYTIYPITYKPTYDNLTFYNTSGSVLVSTLDAQNNIVQYDLDYINGTFTEKTSYTGLLSSKPITHQYNNNLYSVETYYPTGNQSDPASLRVYKADTQNLSQGWVMLYDFYTINGLEHTAFTHKNIVISDISEDGRYLIMVDRNDIILSPFSSNYIIFDLELGTYEIMDLLNLINYTKNSCYNVMFRKLLVGINNNKNILLRHNIPIYNEINNVCSLTEQPFMNNINMLV